MFSCFSNYLDQVAGSACLADARRTFFAKLAVICRVRGSRWVHKFIRKAESFAHGDIAQPALRVAYASSVLILPNATTCTDYIWKDAKHCPVEPERYRRRPLQGCRA